MRNSSSGTEDAPAAAAVLPPAAAAPTDPSPEPLALALASEPGTDRVAAERAPAASAEADKRRHLRFDKVFPVRVESILFGDCHCVARNVSAGGIFLETRDPLPLGARVRVCFLTPTETAEIVAVGEVKNHYFVNFVQAGVTKSLSGMAVRFLSFEHESQHVLRACLDRLRILH